MCIAVRDTAERAAGAVRHAAVQTREKSGEHCANEARCSLGLDQTVGLPTRDFHGRQCLQFRSNARRWYVEQLLGTTSYARWELPAMQRALISLSSLALIFLLAVPQKRRERELVEAVCVARGGCVVGVDTAGRGDNSRHRWASACAELTCALAVDKKPFVSLLTTPNSKELRELAAVPHWARIAVLRPKFKCECDFSNYDCQRTENNRRCSRCCAVQLQWLMQIAHAEELEYCQLHRSHGSKKRNYLTNDDLTLASGDVLSAAQHGQLTTMFKRLRNEIARTVPIWNIHWQM